MCVLNTNETDMQLQTDRFVEVMSESNMLLDVLNGEKLSNTRSILIPSMSFRLFELKK